MLHFTKEPCVSISLCCLGFTFTGTKWWSERWQLPQKMAIFNIVLFLYRSIMAEYSDFSLMISRQLAVPMMIRYSCGISLITLQTKMEKQPLALQDDLSTPSPLFIIYLYKKWKPSKMKIVVNNLWHSSPIMQHLVLTLMHIERVVQGKSS